MGSEWTYLLTTRVVAGNNNPFTFVRLKYGNNATDTVSGVVIYPDDFSFADAGVGAMTFGAAAPAVIDIDSWRALENAGCVFLPFMRRLSFDNSGSFIDDGAETGLNATYITSSAESANGVYSVQFYYEPSRRSYVLYSPVTSSRYMRMPVRLVQDL